MNAEPGPGFEVAGYEILGLIGRGGMGAVYRARQTALDRVVALKTIALGETVPPAAIDRFEREAKAVARLAHPHIVAAYDFGRSGMRLHFAMELVEGEDAERFIARRGRLDEWTAWGLVRQAAAGLAHAADLGIVHRDVKPANLLLTRPPAGYPLPAGLPMLKIADFGLARLVDAAADSRLTAVGFTAGTPCSMAPEQFQGGDVGPAADIYALGASVWHMLAGRPPFAGLSVPQIVARHVERRSDPLEAVRPDVSRGSTELVRDMMAADPARRPGDYATLLRRIDALDLASPAEVATADLPARRTEPGPTADVILRAPGTAPGAPRVAGPHARPGPRLWASLAGAAAIILGGWALVASRGHPVARELTVAGRTAPLFDGQDLAAWVPATGEWSIATDDEGARVLAGRGVAARTLAFADADGGLSAPEHFRLAAVVAMHEAETVRLRFDLPADAGRATGAWWELRLASAEAALVRAGPAHAARPAASLALAAAEGGRRAIEVERQPRGWIVAVDGQMVGTAPILHPRPAARVELTVDGGPAWFSDVFLAELLPATGR